MNYSAIQNEAKHTSKLAWPIIGTLMIQMSMTFVDTSMLGHHDKMALAGIGLASPFFRIFLVIGIGILSALNPLIAKNFGQEKYSEIGRLMKHGMLISILLTISTYFYFSFSDDVFYLMHQKTDIILKAMKYLNFLSWGLPAMFGYICIRQLLEATSNPIPALIAAITGLLINIIGNYLLIFGHFGFPKMGIAGAALATSVAHWAMFLVALIFVQKSHVFRSCKLWNNILQIDPGMLRQICALGFPIGGMLVAEIGYFSAVQFLIGAMGIEALASHQIAINAVTMVFMIPLGLSLATSIRIGQYSGKNDWDSIGHTVIAGIIVVSMIMTFFAIMFMFFATPIVQLYTSNQEILAIATTLIMIAGVFQIVDGLQVMGVMSLRGLKDTRIPFINTVISFWIIGFPLSYWLGFKLMMGPTGVWYSMIFSITTAAILHLRRFKCLYKKFRLELIHEQNNISMPEMEKAPMGF